MVLSDIMPSMGAPRGAYVAMPVTSDFVEYLRSSVQSSALSGISISSCAVRPIGSHLFSESRCRLQWPLQALIGVS